QKRHLVMVLVFEIQRELMLLQRHLVMVLVFEIQRVLMLLQEHCKHLFDRLHAPTSLDNELGACTWRRTRKGLLKMVLKHKQSHQIGPRCKEGPKGEDKYCAESLETLMNFVISKLGKNVQAFSSSFLSKQEEYTVEGVHNLGGKAVMCHRLNFQKAVFYCHEVHETTAFMVPLLAGDGTKTQALAVCHFDTSVLNFELFRQIMKVDPGTNPLCHFLGNKSILWVPNLATEGASQTKIVV
ncbi:Embryonic abundant protein USP92, partial [Glycine soja]